MAQFQFQIPAGEFSTSPDVPATTTIFTVDKGFSRSVAPKILVSKFGDGYEQRIVDGINPKQDIINVTFTNRLSSEINLLAKFFDTRAAKSFDLTVTDFDGNSILKVVCETYNINYTTESVHSIECSLRRVYEP